MISARCSLLIVRLSLIAPGCLLDSCAGQPFLSAGTPDSAEVGYSGDLAAATEVAKEHCARYEKVPRYLDSAEDIAFFACEKR
ncbi:MAG: hypothetical protein JO081_11600 [Alphaproteobacteria bacterium]|nr:hypothetical protein [Alphaproteobacteria bacterium]